MNDEKTPIQNAVFRETKQTYSLLSYKDDQQALASLINQAKTSIKIYSYCLCPAVFNTQIVIDACEAFILKNHRTSIEILVQDSRSISDVSHRLLALSHKHISSVSFKRLKKNIPPQSYDFVCIDRSAYFQLPNPLHYEGLCNFSDASRTAVFLSNFNDAWERSHTDSEFRNLLI